MQSFSSTQQNVTYFAIENKVVDSAEGWNRLLLPGGPPYRCRAEHETPSEMQIVDIRKVG